METTISKDVQSFDKCSPIDPIQFDWSKKGMGWGNFYFYVDDEDGQVHCANECMSKEFIKEMLCTMVDKCILDED